MNRVEIDNRQARRWLANFVVGSGLVGVREGQKLLMAPVEDVDFEPRFVKPTDGHFFDIRKNRTGEVAKVIQEELETDDDTKRVTNSEPVKTLNGVPQIDFSEYNVHARAERLATIRSFELAKSCNLIFWISAEDGAMGLTQEEAKEKGFVYSDGRFNILFRDKEGNEIVLKGKHMPLSIDRFESLGLGQRLLNCGGKTLGPVETVEDLRVQPIGFDLEELGTWIDECRKMMPEFERFWKMFENGDDLKQEAEVKKHVEEAKSIAKGDNVVFQREMEARGYKIRQSGNHGSGWLPTENQTHNYKIQVIDGKFYTEPMLDKSGDLICPICGAKVTLSELICNGCGIGLLQNKN
jgi:hypothetical protein